MSFPEPAFSDHWDCNAFFALKPMEPADCLYAFHMLPSGTEPILFKNNAPQGDPYGLPFDVTYGTCNIRFQAAGPAAERLDVVPFIPNDMRNMAGFVYEHCIEDVLHQGIKPGTQGGYVSKELSNTIDYLTDPDADIAGFFLEWPLNTSYFTMMMWDINAETSTEPEMDFNPGNEDPILGNQILSEIDIAMDKFKEGSHAKQELRLRYEYVRRASEHMHLDGSGNKWWDYWPPGPALSLVNATSPSFCKGKVSGRHPGGVNCSQLLQSG